MDWRFGGETARIGNYKIPGDCASGLVWLYAAQDRFRAAVDDLGDDEVFELRPAHWG